MTSQRELEVAAAHPWLEDKHLRMLFVKKKDMTNPQDMAFELFIEATVFPKVSAKLLILFSMSSSTDRVATLSACKLKSVDLTVPCNQWLCSAHKFW